MPASAAARFILSATHWWEMSSMGRLRFLEWKDARSAKLSTQVGWDRDLSAFASLVARGLGPDADYRRVLIELKVAAAQRQGLRDPEPGPEHDPEGHADGEARSGRHQGVRFLLGEIVQEFLRSSRQPDHRFRGKCQVTSRSLPD